ncbi:hypothetical protein ACMATS_29160 [Streptoverticillium reticulum]|uniref:hypothetical protein n=1 Tax=Streptoverticillium reticulum TaxID=1433415 RepID=UPI0039BF027F
MRLGKALAVGFAEEPVEEPAATVAEEPRAAVRPAAEGPEKAAAEVPAPVVLAGR